MRVRPLSFWTGARIAAARAILQELADRTAEAGGTAPRLVPALHPSATADQLAVLLAQAELSGLPSETIDQLMASLTVALDGGFRP